MLPSLTSRVVVHINDYQMVAVRYARLPKKRILQTEILPIARSVDKSEESIVAEMLTKLFTRDEFKGLSTEFIFSHHYTKQKVAEWNQQLSQEDQQALLKHQLSETYGLNDQSFEVVLSDQGFNKHKLAFTLSKTLLSTINALVSQKKIKRALVSPYFANCINYWHQNITKNAWVIVHEENVLHIGKVAEDNWQSFKTYTIKAPHELATKLKRELLFQATEDDFNVYLMTDSPEKFNSQEILSSLDTKRALHALKPKVSGNFPLPLRFLAYSI